MNRRETIILATRWSCACLFAICSSLVSESSCCAQEVLLAPLIDQLADDSVADSITTWIDVQQPNPVVETLPTPTLEEIEFAPIPITSGFESVSDPRDSSSTYADDIGGIEITPPRGEAQLYSLTISGRIQARYSYFDDNSLFDNPALNEFELERVRLGFRGYVYEKYLRYNIGTDWDSDGAGGVALNGSLLHAFVQFNLQDAVGLGWGDSTSLRVGFWRTNFGRQVAESSQRLQFVDRSLTSAVFNLGNNGGIALLGKFTHNYRPVRYEAAILNGFGTASSSPRDELDKNLAFALRITEELTGDYEAGEGDNELSPFQAIRIGASFGFTRRTRRPPRGASSEFDNAPAILLVNNAATGDAFFAMDQLRGSEREYDLWLGGVEADWKHAGWSLHTEYLLRWIDNVRFASADNFRDFTHGFYVQGGYFITEKVEVVARHSAIFAEGHGSGSPIRADYHTHSRATGGGLNFYFRKHNSKFQIDVFYYDGAPISASSLNLVAGDRGIMLRTQYQLAF